jgi:hypothetical protein
MPSGSGQNASGSSRDDKALMASDMEFSRRAVIIRKETANVDSFPLARRALPLVVLIGLAAAARPALGAFAYSADFEAGAGPEWTNRTTDVSPSGHKLLGQFSDQTVGLSLTGLPEQRALRVSFDLFVIQSWDGNDTASGPDVWDLRVAGGPVLAHTTFSNVDSPQSYPGFLTGGEHPARTGASENGTLGYSFGSDSVYHLTFTFPHTERSLLLNFSALGLDPLDSASWGLAIMSVAPPRTSSQPAE